MSWLIRSTEAIEYILISEEDETSQLEVWDNQYERETDSKGYDIREELAGEYFRPYINQEEDGRTAIQIVPYR